MQMREILRQYADQTQQALAGYLPSADCLQGKVIEAMGYSLLSGGKRIRAALVLEFARLCSGREPSFALPFAGAMEMVHAYSLIHDDLPCMDDDDLRRGKPSCHIAYGETTALLAGDALLSLAFETMAQTDQSLVSAEASLRCVRELGFASGARGMVGGQVIDLMMEDREVGEEVLKEMHLGKTGRMIICAARIGCICGGGTSAQLQAATEYAAGIGRVFQIVDDILDVTGDEAILGKPIGSDAQQHKTTYASLLGIEQAGALAEQINRSAKDAVIAEFGADSGFLTDLADYLLERKN